MPALVDVDKDITCLVATIPIDIVLDGLGTKGLVVAVSELQV